MSSDDTNLGLFQRQCVDEYIEMTYMRARKKGRPFAYDWLAKDLSECIDAAEHLSQPHTKRRAKVRSEAAETVLGMPWLEVRRIARHLIAVRKRDKEIARGKVPA